MTKRPAELFAELGDIERLREQANLVNPFAFRPLADLQAELLAQRERARREKDFATSDRLRSELAHLGVEVTGGPEGQKWRVIGS